MSMQFLTLLQLVGVAILYIGIFIILPGLTFRGKFAGRPVFVRFMAYLSIGNFYVMNLVFFLQLFSISNRTTLILGVLIPMLIAIAVMNWQEWVKASLVTAGETTHNVMVSTMGFRLLFTRIFQNFWQAVVSTAKALAESISLRWIDWIGTAIVIGLTCWQYGTNLFTSFGYTASDMLVHNHWINSMNENDIFVAGVYPFGFHCVIYYLHAVFGIETYVILRVFSLIETVLIHLMLVNILRLICKLETMAYVATAVYLLLNVWSRGTFTRYFSSLPQEYGMVFILPAVCFLILFLQDRWDDKEDKGFKNDSTQMLTLFAINVSMTLAIHFYDTIALGVFCVAIAIGFAYRVFRKEFIFRIVGFGLAAILVAVLPMWIAYHSGTPIEGSLRWGLSILNGYKEQNVGAPSQLQDDGIGAGARSNSQNNISNNTIVSAANVTAQIQPQREVLQAGAVVLTQSRSFGEKLGSVFQHLKAYLAFYLFRNGTDLSSFFILLMMFLGGAMSVFFFLRHEEERGSLFAAVVLNLLFFCVIMVSKELGIPVLMDRNRCSVFMVYFLTILMGMLLDQFLGIFLSVTEEDLVLRVTPAVIGLVAFVLFAFFGWIRSPEYVEAFQKNGAIISVTNILKDNKKDSFTILSANDELRMIEDYGFHFEMDDFLIDNMGNNWSSFLIIPTAKVYIFVEKIPGTYDEPYIGSGLPVSRESASRSLPVDAGILMYKGEKRHIVMSKMYYWVQEFHRLFENEISVYYEDYDFVCYEITQNPDRPYDMSFAYGYNN